MGQLQKCRGGALLGKDGEVEYGHGRLSDAQPASLKARLAEHRTVGRSDSTLMRCQVLGANKHRVDLRFPRHEHHLK